MEYFNVSQSFYISTQESLTDSPPKDYLWKYELSGKIRSSFAIITIIVGVIGNAISFRVMTSSSLRRSSSGVYFAFIAIADTLTLLIGQISALLYHLSKFDVVNVHYWSCRWFFFLLFAFADTGVWTMVAVTVDRFISVVFPLKRKQLCTPMRALASCVGLAVVAAVKNVHLFWTRGRQLTEKPPGNVVVVECGFPREDYEFFERFIRPWLAFTLYAFIPLTSLAFFNIVIAVALWRHSKAKEKHSEGPARPTQQADSSTGTSSSTSATKTSSVTSKASRQTSQLTAMLLTVSVTFTILITPSIVVLIAKPYVVSTDADRAAYSILESLVDTLSYINHSTNFFLYCLSGAGFRKEVKKMFGFDKNKIAIAEGSGGDSTTVQETANP